MSKYAYLLLTKEKWWKRRFEQRRAEESVQAFVRKNAVGPKKTTRLFFYVTNQVQEIRGTGEFQERVVGGVEAMWQRHRDETVFNSHDEYLDFLQGRGKVTFIRFSNLCKLASPIPLPRILRVIGSSRLPRNGKYLSKNTANKLLGVVP